MGYQVIETEEVFHWEEKWWQNRFEGETEGLPARAGQDTEGML